MTIRITTSNRKARKFMRVGALVLIATCCPAAADPASPFDAIKGSWQGAVQMEDSTAPDGHSVGRLSVHVAADGAIDAVHGNGCKLSGVVRKQYVTSFAIDARMTGCAHIPFNRRWNGHFNTDEKFQSAKFSLSSSDLLPNKKIRQVDVAGTLMR